MSTVLLVVHLMIAAALVGTIIFGVGGWQWEVLLLTFLITSSALSRAFTAYLRWPGISLRVLNTLAATLMPAEREEPKHGKRVARRQLTSRCAVG